MSIEDCNSTDLQVVVDELYEKARAWPESEKWTEDHLAHILRLISAERACSGSKKWTKNHIAHIRWLISTRRELARSRELP